MGEGGPIHVKRRRHTPEQVIRKLREAERRLAEGKTTAEATKALEVSEHTLHRWRNQYGGMKADDVKGLKELRRENATLKRIVADKELENVAVKEIAKGNSRPGPEAPGRRDAPGPPRPLRASGVPDRQHRSTQRHEPTQASDDAALRAEPRGISAKKPPRERLAANRAARDASLRSPYGLAKRGVGG
jgi:transposase-like protein